MRGHGIQSGASDARREAQQLHGIGGAQFVTEATARVTQPLALKRGMKWPVLT